MKYVMIMLAAATYCTAWSCQTVDAGECCEVQCPCCKHYCKLSTEIEVEEKHCWKVKCEPICIPKICFPWEKPCHRGCRGCCKGCQSCKPKGAKLRYVKVIEKHEYECERCKYKFTPECCHAPSCHAPVPEHIEGEAPAPPAIDAGFRSSRRPTQRGNANRPNIKQFDID